MENRCAGHRTIVVGLLAGALFQQRAMIRLCKRTAQIRSIQQRCDLCIVKRLAMMLLLIKPLQESVQEHADRTEITVQEPI